MVSVIYIVSVLTFLLQYFVKQSILWASKFCYCFNQHCTMALLFMDSWPWETTGLGLSNSTILDVLLQNFFSLIL